MKQDIKIPEGYKNSSLGVIPEEWEVKRLGEICPVFKSGSSITSKNISKDNLYPVYGGNGLRGYTNTYTHEGSYILIGRQGALCGNINYVTGKCYISEHAIAVKSNKGNNIIFLKYKLSYWNLNRFSESSAQPGLSAKKLIRYKLALPTLPEQQKIADILSTWDKDIEKQTQLINLLEQSKHGLMQQLLTGKKRLKGFTDKWETVKFGEIMKKISNGLTYNVAIKGEFPVTRIETISKGIINYSKISYAEKIDNIERYRLIKGDILFSHINSLTHIGKLLSIMGNFLYIMV